MTDPAQSPEPAAEDAQSGAPASGAPADGAPAGDVPATPASGAPARPSWRERLRPLELLGISGVLAAFAGVVTAIVLHPWGEFTEQAAQSWLTVLIVFGVSFILTLVTLAMLALRGYEAPEAPDERGVLGKRDEERGSPH